MTRSTRGLKNIKVRPLYIYLSLLGLLSPVSSTVVTCEGGEGGCDGAERGEQDKPLKSRTGLVVSLTDLPTISHDGVGGGEHGKNIEPLPNVIIHLAVFFLFLNQICSLCSPTPSKYSNTAHTFENLSIVALQRNLTFMESNIFPNKE
jgi:hypothetical protein